MWTGKVDRQLGYAAIAFPAATGRVLRITQDAPTAHRDAFGRIVELATARQSGDTGADAVPVDW